MRYASGEEVAERFNKLVAENKSLQAENERLRQSLRDILDARSIWHGGVGPVPREHLLGLIDGMKAEASAALAGGERGGEAEWHPEKGKVYEAFKG